MIDMDYTDIKWQQLLAAGYFLTIETPSQFITVHMPINGELMQRFGLYITPLDTENKVDVHLFKNFTEAYEAMQRIAPLMDWQVHCQDMYGTLDGGEQSARRANDTLTHHAKQSQTLFFKEAT